MNGNQMRSTSPFEYCEAFAAATQAMVTKMSVLNPATDWPGEGTDRSGVDRSVRCRPAAVDNATAPAGPSDMSSTPMFPTKKYVHGRNFAVPSQ